MYKYAHLCVCVRACACMRAQNTNSWMSSEKYIGFEFVKSTD